MHISEGVLSPTILGIGAAVAVAGIAIGLRQMREDRIMETGILSAAFFLGSLIHVPVGFGSAHLLLCGLLGVMLGWAAFPAIFAALLLQAILLQFGGLTTLGVNTATMGGAAVCAFYIFEFLRKIRPGHLKFAAFCGGFAGVAIAALLTSLALAFTNEGFVAAAGALLLAHVPVMIAEGLITAVTVSFIARVRPQMLPIQILNSKGSIAPNW
ncbi:MAG: cobalt transporter CbiM [Desulfovibrio sp.]|jgi:cobalt/nickel transport system permease protein|nr:cobalt transporter CbiM [Desulfovibrio sp.]